MTNDFVPFCNENTGTNLPTQSAYIANPNLPIGNQPGIASSSLNNKALRQATTIAAVVAQFASNTTGADMLDNQNTADHAIPAALLAALTATFKRHSPVTTTYLSSSGSHNVTYKFQIATGNATIGATYSDGTTTYTVKATIASGTQLDASGGATPAAVAGTLTKLGGTGDTTITYYAYSKPLYLHVRMVGGGGGGAGSGTTTSPGFGGNGGATTFGSSLLTCSGGIGGGTGTGGGQAGAGGSGGSLGTASGIALDGARGYQAGALATAGTSAGGQGGSSTFGGGGFGGAIATAGVAGITNTGSGGGGAGSPAANTFAGNGGGAGSYVEAFITSPLSQYAYSIGTAGTAGTAGTSGSAGGAGAAGLIIVEEHYQ